MRSKNIWSLLTGGVLAAMFIASPSEARAQRSGVEIWEANCGRCHLIQPTNKYVAKDWRSVGLHMGIQARLTTTEREAVIGFLVSGARPADGRQAQRLEPDASPDFGVPTLTDEAVARLAEYLASLEAVPPREAARGDGS